MPMLTGGESSRLCYLADYPNAPDVEEVIAELGAVAREVALDILGRHPNPKPNVRAAAQAIKDWAIKMHLKCSPKTCIIDLYHPLDIYHR